MELLSELKRYFNLSSFRPGQEEVVRAVAEGRDALVVMPTGGGHQFSPILLEEATASRFAAYSLP